MPSPALSTVLFTSPYVRQARELFDSFTTPPTTDRRVLINALIKSLIQAGIWDKLDAFYMMAAADAQSSLLNWVSTSYNLTAVNSPAFVADRGYTGDGSTSYLDTNFNPTTAVGAKFVQDSANMGLWSRTDLQNAAASSFDMGQTNAQIDRFVSVAGRATGRANTGSGVTFGDGFYPKHAMWSRTAAAVWESYAQGVDAGGGTTASAAMTNANFRILSVAAGQFGANQIAAAHFGSGLSAVEAGALYSALNTFMVAVGAA